jgi:hypothetical protein
MRPSALGWIFCSATVLAGCSFSYVRTGSTPHVAAQPAGPAASGMDDHGGTFSAAFPGSVPVLGDSISNNPYVSPDKQWSALLASAGADVKRGCSLAFVTVGAKDYNVKTVSHETDWPTFERQLLRIVDVVHANCSGAPVVMTTYAFNFTRADLRYSTFTRLYAFIRAIAVAGTRPWVVLADLEADPRFHRSDSASMYNDFHENTAGQEPMAQDIELALAAYQNRAGRPGWLRLKALSTAQTVP